MARRVALNLTFDPETIENAKRIADGAKLPVSSWIEQLVLKEIREQVAAAPKPSGYEVS